MSIAKLFRHLTYQVFAPGALLRSKYNAFRELLKVDEACHRFIADLEEAYYGTSPSDWARMVWLSRRLSTAAARIVDLLQDMCPSRCMDLPAHYKKIDFYVRLGLDLPQPDVGPPYVMPLSEAASCPDLAGGKAANLAVAGEAAGLAVLPGVVATTNAFRFFVECNDLRPRLDKLLRHVDLAEPRTLEEAAESLVNEILDSEVPEALAGDIEAALDHADMGSGPLAVRSSAGGEDGPASFAGQYASELDVPPKDALAAYKRVLAGKYAPRALAYRILLGLPDDMAPMAVLFQPMLRFRASGIMYTLDPDERLGETLALYPVPGQGDVLADGGVNAKVVRFSRRDPPQPAAPEEAEAILPPDAAQDLAKAGLALEARFGSPQDVEWGRRKDGRLYVLQSRPLQLERGDEPHGEAGDEPTNEVLAQGLESVSRGIGSGRVHHVADASRLAGVPHGAVVVAKTLSPSLAVAVGRMAAVVAAAGSRASHFASVAREFGVPVLVCGEDVFRLLPQGVEVTVDARRSKVYRGRIEETSAGEASPGVQVKGPVRERLARVMPYLTRLNLTDPHSEDFSPGGCRSLHDIVRLAHETAVTEMFSLVGKGGRGLSGSRKLESPLPLVMYVLDLGGGLSDEAQGRDVVHPKDFVGMPMRSLWQGLATDKAFWSQGLPHMDWEEFDRISRGVFSRDTRLLASYAVLSGDYLHLMVRFGYHFSVLDSVCGQEANANYANFQFRGGGGSFEQRVLRLEFIKRVLARCGFSIETKGDLLNAAYARDGLQGTAAKLTVLGALMAETRLMDMGLARHSQVEEAEKRFLADHGTGDKGHGQA